MGRKAVCTLTLNQGRELNPKSNFLLSSSERRGEYSKKDSKILGIFSKDAKDALEYSIKILEYPL